MLKLDDITKLHQVRRVMENAQYEARQQVAQEIDALETILVERTVQAIVAEIESSEEAEFLLRHLVREAMNDAYRLRDYARDFGIQ